MPEQICLIAVIFNLVVYSFISGLIWLIQLVSKSRYRNWNLINTAPANISTEMVAIRSKWTNHPAIIVDINAKTPV